MTIHYTAPTRPWDHIVVEAHASNGASKFIRILRDAGNQQPAIQICLRDFGAPVETLTIPPFALRELAHNILEVFPDDVRPRPSEG